MSTAVGLAHEQETIAPSTEQLLEVLSRALDPSRRIVDVQRAPCPYGSSWWLEEITLHLDDNSRVALVFKRLDTEAGGSGAREIKPTFVTDPTREPWVYRTLLPEAPPGPPKFCAELADFAGGRHWLFLERVEGVPLSQLGDIEAWCTAARWLGRFHACAPIPHARGPLLWHDQDYHRRWLGRALSAAQADARRLARLQALVPVHRRAAEEVLAGNASLIHGEFYPSNVLVETNGVVHPVDWEMAALGPPQLDLAALLTGRWSADERSAMTIAYREGAGAAAMRYPLDEFMRGVAACRLLLAVQWLGWAPGWTAPADHRNDWLEEAERCAKELCE